MVKWDLQPDIYMKKLKRNTGFMEVAPTQPYDEIKNYGACRPEIAGTGKGMVLK